MTALLFFLCFSSFTISLKSHPSYRGKIRKAFIMEGEVFEELFYAYGSHNTDHNPVSAQRSTNNFQSPVIYFVLCYYFGHAALSQGLLQLFHNGDLRGGSAVSLRDF